MPGDGQQALPARSRAAIRASGRVPSRGDQASAAEFERLRRSVERERKARREAERLAEQTTRALYAQVAERTRELESVLAMGREVAAALDSQAVGDLIARHIANAVGFDECGIYAWERSDALVRTVGYHPIERRAVLDETFSLADYPETAQVLETRKVSVTDVGDTQADSAELAFLTALGGQLMFQIPMVVNQQAIGTVELLARTDASLDERQIALAQTMASEAGVLFENARLYAHIRHQAFYDHLTGLPNRALFGDRLRHALARRSEDPSHRSAVFFVDVDDFKVINDRYGHAIGDAVLSAVADRLQSVLRPGDTVARLSGDEFGILVEDVSGRRGAAAVAARIVEAFERPLSTGQHDITVSASVGVDVESAPNTDAEALIRNADFAMYGAKQSGKRRYRLYRSEERTAADEGARLRADLRGVTARDELRLHYQPIVDLRTGDVVDMEALVRWEHPERGLLLPNSFIPIAEEMGIVVEIGEWVLERACRQLRWWREQAPSIDVSVNLSARQLHSERLADQVRGALDRSGLKPSALVLEVTESILADDSAETMLRDLKDIGVRLAIDDFGTGYSSISYLRRFPIDILKIDREFTRELTTADGVALFGGIVQLAHGLGLLTVAEGIEEIAQRDRAAAASCDRGQGFLFARPAPPEDIQLGRTLSVGPSVSALSGI
jgi:diguanylate cyclase (GGDEF)-like protein